MDVAKVSQRKTKHSQFSSDFEVICSYSIWILGVFYSIYCFQTRISTFFESYKDYHGDFDEGWLLIGRKKDISDSEWSTFIILLRNLLLHIVPYLFILEYLKQKRTWKLFQLTSALFGVYILNLHVSFKYTPIVLSVFLLFHLISKFNKIWLIWVTSLAVIVVSTFNEHLRDSLGYDHYYYSFQIILYWNLLRLTSYFVDAIKGGEKHSAIDAFCYVFYVPLICGPYIRYQDFRQIYLPSNESLVERFKCMVKGFARFAFWFLFLDFATHFVYVNAVVYHPELVASFNNWELCGYGYSMGQQFHLKYLLIYGFPTTFAAFQGIKTPEVPKCIGRIHRYSDMWRYFDVGLHQFLAKYIYIPTMKSASIYNRTFSSFLCFMYVYIWHGVRKNIFIWSILNFLGVTIEAFAMIAAEHNEFYKTFNSKWKRRFACLIATPLTIMSIVSNFYFLGGIDVGNLFWAKIFRNDWMSNCAIIFFIYNLAQVSTELRSRNRKVKLFKE